MNWVNRGRRLRGQEKERDGRKGQRGGREKNSFIFL